MKKGIGVVWVIVIVVAVVLAILISIWQYRMYVQRKNIQKIEDQIMNGTYPGI